MERLTTSAMIVLMAPPIVAQAIGVECQVPVQAATSVQRRKLW